MSVSVIVPLSPSAPERATVWRWLARQYATLLAAWEIRVGSAPGYGWSKGRALRSAVERASGDVLVVADADSWLDPVRLAHAAELVAEGVPWVVPHDRVWRLAPAATARVLSGYAFPDDLAIPDLERRPHYAPAGGGVAVVTRAAWNDVGGVDPRFNGWGGDDVAFGWALDTLTGQHVRLPGPLWHLWHPPHPSRRQPGPNDELAGRYLDARGDPEAMRALTDEACLAR